VWQLRKILVPIDLADEENAHHTISFALSLARDFAADLYVLYVYQIPTLIDLLSSPLSLLKAKEDLVKEARNSAEERLTNFLRKIPEPDVDMHPLLRTGSPYEEILTAAQELDTDLIIMGTRALKGIDYLLLGSTAERVVRMASCPVITIKPKHFQFIMP